MEELIESFRKDLEEYEIVLSDLQIKQFITYYELLIEKNKVMNLTGITDIEEVFKKHFVDSLSLNKELNLNNIQGIIDVGTGAGFPGIPLKIAFPHLEVVLLDSLNKRVKFLNEVIKELELTGITGIHGRAEDYGREKKYRESFDLCVSRAVAHLSSLAEYCMPFVKKDGYFIPFKSGKIEEEINESKKAIKEFGGKIERTPKFSLVGTDMERSFIFIKKIKNISNKYPRKSGIPTKEPIK